MSNLTHSCFTPKTYEFKELILFTYGNWLNFLFYFFLTHQKAGNFCHAPCAI